MDAVQPLTPKAQRTRLHILETALHLFGVAGYEATTMRQIATAAGCSLGLTYRYFASKDDLVLALYARLETEFAAAVGALPAGPLASRFVTALQAKLAVITPYRDALAALFGAALNPHSAVAVVGDQTTAIREQVRAVFVEVVAGSTDAPAPPVAGQLATLLYGLHLALIFIALSDRSAEGRTTQELLAFTGECLTLIAPLLTFPGADVTLARFAGVMGPALGIADPARPGTPLPVSDS